MSEFNFKLTDIISDDKLQDYLKKGWEALSDDYKKSGKEVEQETVENMNNPQDQQNLTRKTKFDKAIVLKILGAIREHIVQKIFDQSEGDENKGNNNYFAAGSTNITSDYDISITGPQANDIMWKMFTLFLEHYKEALPIAFDSNLYSSPIYISKSKKGIKIDCRTVNDIDDILGTLPRVDYPEDKNDHFVFVPKTEAEMNEELEWAGMKLLHKTQGGLYDAESDEINYTMIMKILNRSIELKKHLLNECKQIENDQEYKDTLAKFSFLNGDSDRIKETKLIFKNYYMQWKAQKKIQDFVYGKQPFKEKDIETVKYGEVSEKKKNIFYYSNKANYYASEAYYTSSAVNAIVVENQLKHNLDYGKRPFKYIVNCKLAAAIEQIGDMTHHIHSKKIDANDPNSLKKIIVKFSKYIYRFFYILGTIGDGGEYEHYEHRAKKIDKHIIPIRAKYDVENIEDSHWKLLSVKNINSIIPDNDNNNMEIKKADWLLGVRKDMFNIIEHFLTDIDEISENYQKAQEAKKEMKEMKKLQFEQDLTKFKLQFEQDLDKFNEQSKKNRKRFKRRKSTGSLEDLKRRYLPMEGELYNKDKSKGGKKRKKKKRTKKKNNKKKKKKTKRRRN